MKSVALASAFLTLGFVLGAHFAPRTVHAQTSQPQLGPEAEVTPRSELVEEVKPGEWVPNFKGTLRAVSLSCVPGDRGATCYVLLQSR